jgi:hypothetical protein
MQSMSLTNLRSQLYKVVDNVIETGLPVEIERNGHIVKIVLEQPKSKLSNLSYHDCIVGDPEELVDLPTCEWQDDPNL